MTPDLQLSLETRVGPTSTRQITFIYVTRDPGNTHTVKPRSREAAKRDPSVPIRTGIAQRTHAKARARFLDVRELKVTWVTIPTVITRVFTVRCASKVTIRTDIADVTRVKKAFFI